MSTTIDSLDIQIQTSAGNAADNIDRLAAALGRLKSNAGLTKIRKKGETHQLCVSPFSVQEE